VPADRSDDQLLHDARAGDRAALSALLERHAASVYRFGLKMCRNPADAQDIVQDTLLAASKGLEGFRGEASLATWLYTVARSFCIKKHRSSKFAPAALQSLETDASLAELPGAGPRPDDAAHDRQLARVLEAALDRLDAPQREVLLLRDVEGFTAPEVATILEISVEAVKSRLHRARAELRALLAPYLPEHERPDALAGSPSCPEIISVFSRYLEGEIGASECEAMQGHVAVCKRCDAACASLRHALSLCHTAPRAEIPAEVTAMIKAALRTLTQTAPPREPH
jgi:RNA polymerase sigma-70 factor, ECF subfamily